MMNFEFSTAKRILFGLGVSDDIAPAINEMGNKAFMVTGSNISRALPFIKRIEGLGVKVITFSVSGEPTIETILAAVQAAKENKCDVVIGIGGGSVIDTGKAIAALLTNSGDLEDYLEVIGKGKQIQNASAPYIAVPTTSGTGAEVTQNAVIGSLKHNVKVSMRSPLMLPSLSVVDPLLTLSVPKVITATTGLDSLTQLIEPFVSHKSNPLTDGLCREGMMRAARSLKKAYQHGDNAEAREDMSLASLFGGMALANAKLGAVHGFAGPIGGMFSAPHGAICAKLLPPVIETNVQALKERSPASPTLAKFDEVARILTNSSDVKASDAVIWIQELCDELNLPALSEFGVTESDISAIVSQSKNASSMKGNPIDLTEDELAGIMQKALQ